MLLNTMSILDCDELDEEQHNEEIQDILEKLYELPDYDCAVVFKYLDVAHKDNQEIIKSCNLHDCFEMIEYADFKNGVDVLLNDDGLLTFIVHGQRYTYKDEYSLVTTAIIIMPYDENKNSIDISYIFEEYQFLKGYSCSLN